MSPDVGPNNLEGAQVCRTISLYFAALSTHEKSLYFITFAGHGLVVSVVRCIDHELLTFCRFLVNMLSWRYFRSQVHAEEV